MAERRMFAKTIIDSDAFTEMPTSARLLYYDLSMRADDDGFVNAPRKIMKITGASDDDLKILLAKKFIIGFENGIVVIKHWKIHNYIQNDRYKPTTYKEEKSMLMLDENKAYKMRDNTQCIQNGYTMDTQVRLGKDSIGKYISSSNSNKEEIYMYVENNFARPLSPIEIERIDTWLETFTNDIVKYAIDLSVLNNKRTISYINGIIKNWKTAGYTTIEQIKENEVAEDNISEAKISEKKPTEETQQLLNEMADYDWFEDE